MNFNRRAIACALFASAGLTLASPQAMAQAVKVGILDHGAVVHSGGAAALLGDPETLECGSAWPCTDCYRALPHDPSH
jgi:hypothetical protein